MRHEHPAPDSDRGNLAALSDWLVPFTLVLYLGMRGGGYGDLIRSEAGIAIWWGVIAFCLAARLPRGRLPRSAWTAFGLLAALAVWTVVGAISAESPESAVAEGARVATHLGAFAIGLALAGPGSVRRAVAGIGGAIALIGLLALSSRLFPGIFGEREAIELLPKTRARLSYPLNYWNGLAALMAIGIPLLCHLAISVARPWLRALTAAGTVVLALTAYLTLSRGGVVEAAVALAVLIAAHPRRGTLLALLAPVGLATALGILAVEAHPAVAAALGDSEAESQGLQVAAIIAALLAAAGFGHLLVERLIARHPPRLPAVSRSIALPGAGAALVIALVAAIALGVPGEVSDRWDEFKQPLAIDGSSDRFEASSGNGRYQYWSAAVDAGESAPVLGIGAGSFDLWWSREGTLPGSVEDAHSLYFEAFGELGISGLLLVLGLIGTVIVAGARRLPALEPGGEREAAAAALAGFAGFAVAAGLDWVWELAVLPVAALLLAAALLAGGTEPAQPPSGRRDRVALVATGIAALAVIAMAGAEERELRLARAQFDGGDYPAALSTAQIAAKIEPWGAEAKLQQAFALDALARPGAAASAAREAIDAEPLNWRPWYVLFTIEARRGRTDSALRAFRRARELNPRSPLFRAGGPPPATQP